MSNRHDDPRRARLGRLVALSAVALGTLVAWRVLAQQQQQPRRAARNQGNQVQQPPRGQPRLIASGALTGTRGVVIETPAPIVNLFQRAEEGVARGDWKLAIDSLQRVIEDPDGAMVVREDTPQPVERGSSTEPPEPKVLGHTDSALPEGSHADVNRPIPMERAAAPGALYESARRVALRMIASLPPEGRRAYGLIHDGKAKGMFERAMASGDRAGLAEVASRFLLTEYGDDAVDALASIALDENRPTEAINVLRELLEFQSDMDVPPSRVTGKLAAAYAMVDRTREAQLAVDDVRRSDVDASDLAWLDRVVRGGVKSARDPSMPSDTGRFAESAMPIGRMSPVRPKLSDQTPWRFTLPMSMAGIWQRILGDDPGDPLALSVAMPVVSDSRLFVRHSTGLIALDADDLGVLWRVAPQPSPVESAALAGARRLNRAALDEDLTPDPLNDYVVGTVTAAFGLVFTNEPQGWGTDDPNLTQVRAAQTSNLGFPLRTRMPTRIVARDQGTGRMVWQRGRTFSADDPLGEVEFRSTPIAVDDRLWVPYVDQRDLYLAILSPADGSLVKRILVCSFKEGFTGRGIALLLARHDDVVYVPTDQGALVAIDVNSETPRWAHVYMESRQPNRGVGASRRAAEGDAERALVTNHPWLPTPPIAAGGAVLLAPTDLDELLAFSATDGALLWSAAAGRSNYVIAADDRKAWIGGRSLACLSMSDGATIWFAQLSEPPTGRAVLCGDVIHIPTAAGLLSVDAETGELRERQVISSAEAPPGNLVCARDSIYSADPSSVRRYPDLQRGFEAALRGLSQNPDNIQAVLRVAWMRMLRDEPGVANDLLANAESRGLVSDESAAVPFSRARVRALQALASVPATAPDRALAYLEAAVSASRESEDRLRSRMILAERRAELGDAARAYEEYLDAGLGADAESVESTEDSVHRRARFEIADRLSRLTSKLTASQQDAALRKLSQIVELPGLPANVTLTLEQAERLRALADLAEGAPLGARALLRLAGHEIAMARWERAEQLLRDCARAEASRDSTLEALVRLVHLRIEQAFGDDRELSDYLNRLESDFASATWDQFGLLFTRIEPPSDSSVRSLVAAARAARASAPLAGDDETQASFDGQYSPTWAIVPKSTRQQTIEAPFSLAGDLLQSLENVTASDSQPRLIKFEHIAEEVLSGRAFFHAQGDVIFAVDVADGALRWSTTLRPMGYFSQLFDDQRGRSGEMGRHAVLDGAVGVFNGTEGLYGVGMDTGRRLWFVPHDTPHPVGREHLGDQCMAGGRGAIVHVSGGGRLSLIRTRDGVVLWSRDMRGEPIEYVALSDERAITTDRHLQRVHLVNRADGSMIARVMFRQPDVDHRLIDLVQAGSLVVGPDAEGGEEAVLAVNLRSGDRAWRMALDKPISALFEPGTGLIGVGLLGGDILLLDAESGDRQSEFRIAAGESIVDARLVGETLLVRTFMSQENLRRFALVALNTKDGTELWRRDDLSSSANLSLPLRPIDGGLPVVVDVEQTHGPAVGAASLGLTLLDLESGRNLGVVAELVGSRSATRLNGDFGFWPGFAIVGTSTGVRAFEGDWPASGRKNY